MVVAIVVFAALIAFIALIKGRRDTPANEYPFRRVDCLLSNAERSFYGVLRRAVGDDGLVFVKVRMADVLVPARGLGSSKRRIAQNRVQAKHFDFVICSATNIAPIVAIELDDVSHRRPERRARDEFVKRAAAAAALPLVRIPAKRAYSPAALRAQLVPHLGAKPVNG